MSSLNILMVASENDALPGAKVGGIGDVLRDIPPALADLGCRVSVVLPSYGFLHDREGTRSIAKGKFRFRKGEHRAELYEVVAKEPHEGVRQLVLHSDVFEAPDPKTGRLRIYCDDPPKTPFATDANRFAAFCSAVGTMVLDGEFGPIQVLHLHDWHTGFLLALREFDVDFVELENFRTVFTIHNLSLQGIRPFRATDEREESNFEAWYPWLIDAYDEDALRDSRWTDCMNPMAAGIRMADAVHAVSPSYADEILEPSESGSGFIGGEGLEEDLREAKEEGRLFGILNGCEYPERPGSKGKRRGEFDTLLDVLETAVAGWSGQSEKEAHAVAVDRIAEMRRRGGRPAVVLTSVSRIVDQKVALMLVGVGPDARPAIQQILDDLGESGLYIMLGTGLPEFESVLLGLARDYGNFLFLNGFSGAVADALYAHGDLFLMPSSFEPCGISQMLAMRAGQPCVVHAVGGLRDTVENDETGFVFSGETPDQQARRFIATVRRAVGLKIEDPERFEEIRRAAKKQRFRWRDAARQYIDLLYAQKPGN